MGLISDHEAKIFKNGVDKFSNALSRLTGAKFKVKADMSQFKDSYVAVDLKKKTGFLSSKEMVIVTAKRFSQTEFPVVKLFPRTKYRNENQLFVTFHLSKHQDIFLTDEMWREADKLFEEYAHNFRHWMTSTEVHVGAFLADKGFKLYA